MNQNTAPINPELSDEASFHDKALEQDSSEALAEKRADLEAIEIGLREEALEVVEG